MSSNIIINSIEESLKIIKKNKKLFLFIFILQFLFFVLLTLINQFYFVGILQSTENIMQYMDSINVDPQTATLEVLGQKNPLGDDPLFISENYNNIFRNLFLLLFFSFIIFVLVNGFIWYLITNLNKKNSIKNIFNYLSKFFIISLILFVFIVLLIYNSINISFSEFLQTNPKNFIPFLLLTIIAIYFIFISIPLLVKKFTKENIFLRHK